MRTTRATALLSIFLPTLLLSAPAQAGDPLPPLISGCLLTLEDDDDRVFIDSPVGPITLQLFPSVAPETVANFEGYVERGDFDDSVVHRTVPDFVIQTGGFTSSGIFFDRIPDQGTVDNEACVSNVAGTIAMAQVGTDPDSATSQWFINLVDNDGSPGGGNNLDTLNGGFTVFGRVLLNGLDKAIEIAELPLSLGAPLDEMDPTGPLALPDLPPFYAAVSQSEWTFFRDSPVQALPIIDPPSYGCFDTSDVAILLTESPTSAGDREPNDALGSPFYIVSSACAGAGGGGPLSIPCTDPGRRALLFDSETGSLVPDAGAEFGFAETTVACDDIAASDASFGMRLADIGDQLNGDPARSFIGFSYALPEPGMGLSVAASLLTLAALTRRSRR